MANSYAEWKREMSNVDAIFAEMNAKIVVVRNLDGIIEFERKLLLNPLRNGEITPILIDYFNKLSTNLFGVTRDQTFFKYPPSFENLLPGTAEWWSFRSAAEEYESMFITDNGTDDEAAYDLLMMGVDFRDDQGNPLRCTKLFGRQANAAALKIMGSLPDSDALRLSTWANKLEDEAKLHLAGKGKR
jgi:hypothetical protein